MLAIVLGGLGIAAVIGIVALVAAGCSGDKDEEKDPGKLDAAPPPPPPPPPAPKCENFERDESHYMVNPRSFDTMKILWGDDLAKAHVTNWNIDTGLHFGANYHLYKTTCDDPSIGSENVATLKNNVKGCLEKHFYDRANQSENGILVLIDCIAPAKMDENSFLVALKAMSAFNQTQENFVTLKEGCYHYNKATEKADNKYTKPSGRKLSKEDKETARAELAKAEAAIAPFRKMIEEGRWGELNSALTYHQQKILFTLMGAMNAYSPTLGKGGKRPGGTGGGGSGGGGGGGTTTTPFDVNESNPFD